jgi:hypothetical protein
MKLDWGILVMQNSTFVTAFCANFDDRLAEFGLTIVGAVKITVAQKLQEFIYCMLHHSFRLCWRKCPRNFADMSCYQFCLFVCLFVLLVHFGAG